MFDIRPQTSFDEHKTHPDTSFDVLPPPPPTPHSSFFPFLQHMSHTDASFNIRPLLIWIWLWPAGRHFYTDNLVWFQHLCFACLSVSHSLSQGQVERQAFVPKPLSLCNKVQSINLSLFLSLSLPEGWIKKKKYCTYSITLIPLIKKISFVRSLSLSLARSFALPLPPSLPPPVRMCLRLRMSER